MYHYTTYFEVGTNLKHEWVSEFIESASEHDEEVNKQSERVSILSIVSM